MIHSSEAGKAAHSGSLWKKDAERTGSFRLVRGRNISQVVVVAFPQVQGSWRDVFLGDNLAVAHYLQEG